MSFYDEIMEGLEEALAFSEGKGQARSRVVSMDENTITSLEESEEEDPLHLGFNPVRKLHPRPINYARRSSRPRAQMAIVGASNNARQRLSYAAKPTLSSHKKGKVRKSTLAKNKG